MNKFYFKTIFVLLLFSVSAMAIAQTAPYSENFDGATAIDPFAGIPGWSIVGPGLNDIELSSTVDFGGNPPSLPNSIELNDGNWGAGDTAIVVTRRFTDLPTGANRIRFQVAFEGAGAELFVGTMSDSSSTATFVPYDTLFESVLGQDAFVSVTIDLDNLGLIGSNEFIAFAHGSSIWEIYIDDFVYEEIPSCADLTGLITSNVTSTSADISWTDNAGATEWQIQYGAPGFTLGSGTLVSTTGLPDTTLGSLTPNTSYDWYVRPVCAPADTGAWIMGPSFLTLCNPFTATYTQNFDGAAEVDPFDGIDCWSVIGPGANDIELTATTDFGVDPAPSAPNSVELNDGDWDAGDTAMLVTPAFSDLSTGLNRIRFQLAFEGTEELYVGVLTDPTSTASFIPVDTFTAAAVGIDVFAEVTVNFDNPTLIGTAQHIAFAHGPSFNEIYIDDFVYEPIPTCIRPGDFSIDSVAGDAVELSWSVPTPAPEWEVEYGPAGFAPGSGTTLIAMNDTFLVTGLMPTTEYDFYVRAICTPGDTSLMVGPLTAFTTFRSLVCGVGQPSIIASEGFEGGVCTGNTEITGVVSWANTHASTGTFGGPLWRIECSGSTSTGWIDVGAQEGVAYLYLESSGAGGFGDPGGDTITTDIYDMAAVQSDAFMNVYYHNDGNSRLLIERSIDGGAWTPVLDNMGPDLGAATNNPWSPFSDDLSGLLPISTIQYRFIGLATASNTGDIGIDDFSIEGCVTCPTPTALTTTAFGGDSILAEWVSGSLVDSVVVEYGVSGFTLGTGNQLTTLEDSIFITGLLPNTLYDVYVSGICAGPDTSLSVSGSETTGCLPIFPAPFCDNFETWNAGNTGPTINDCWSGFNTTDPNWEVESSGTGNSFGTGPLNDVSGSGNYIYLETSGGTLGETDTLFSPQIDLSALTLPELTFSYHMFGDEIGTLSVIIENVNTGLTETVWSVSGQQQTAETDPWLEATAYLTDFIGDTIIIHFVGSRGDGFEGDIAIDEFCINEAPPCPNPTDIAVTDLTNSSVSATWDHPLMPSGYIVEFGPTGFALGTGTMISTPDTFGTITGLMGNTTYDFYFQADCGTDSSAQIGPFTLTTLCDPLATAWCEPFEAWTIGSAGPSIFDCWTGRNTNDPNWEVESGPTLSAGTGPSTDFSGTGNYVFLETSGGSLGEADTLSSPQTDLSAFAFPELTFAYHMFGDDMGTLNIIVEDVTAGTFTNVFSQTGQVQTAEDDPWMEEVVDLRPFAGSTIVIHVEGVRGSGFESDMAIDNICIKEAPTNNVGVVEIIQPQNSCGSDSTQFQVVVENIGVELQSSVPVIIDVTGTDSFRVSQLLFNLDSFSVDTLTLDPVINTLGGGTWTITAYTDLGGDSLFNNDTTIANVTIGLVPDAPMVMDQVVCLGDSTLLTASTSTGGMLNWYDSIGAATPLFTGDSISIAPTMTTTFFVNEQVTDSVTYILDLFDSFGDGWNGGELDIVINGDTSVGSPITLATGSVGQDSFRVQTGDSIELVFTAGGFIGEVSYSLTNPLGDVIFEDGVTATVSTGSVFSTAEPEGCVGPFSTLVVNVANPTLDTVALTGCDDLVLPNGMLATTSGFVTDSLLNSSGCDSVVVYDVTINNSQTIASSVSTCGGSAFTLPDGRVVTTPGTYTSVFTGANGCDSTLITNLSFDANISVFQSEALCFGDSVVVGGNTYTLEGVYIDTFASATGCDSIVTTSVVNLDEIDIDLANLSTICEGASPVDLDINPAGGSLLGPGVSGTTFDPSLAGIGTHILTYEFNDVNGCFGSTSFEVEVVACTGIEEIEGVESVAVFPNPFTDVVNIRFENDVRGDEMQFSIIDMTGRVIGEASHNPIIGDNNVTIEVSDVASGVYVLEIERSGAMHSLQLLRK